MRRNRSIPASTVIPVLGYADVAQAAEWLCNAFGFRERLRIGGHRIQLLYGDGAIVITDAGPERSTQATYSVMVRVTDADAHVAQAQAAGAKVLGPPVSYPYGERQYSAIDPGGHVWTFSESIDDVDPASWGGEWVAPAQGTDSTTPD